MTKKLIILIFIIILVVKRVKIGKYFIQAQSWCTYFVSNDNELQEANSQVSKGETVCLKPGLYTTAIRPSNSGSSESQRIIYRKDGKGNVF
jgi:hypothetical protein